MNDLISIIIPYFRKKKFIQKTIVSVINQSYKNFEIIIIYDDTSFKDYNFILYLKKKYKKIYIYRNKKNIGAGFSRNIGINKAKGKYVCFIDSDDCWDQHKLKKQLNFMKRKKIDISHTSYAIIDKDDNKISSRIARDLDYKNILNSCDIGLSTVMIKKNILNFKNPFPKLKTKEDYVLWLKLAKKGKKFFALKTELANWRKTENSLSSSTVQKILDGFRVYYNYEKMNFFTSIFRVFTLSINYLIKKSK